MVAMTDLELAIFTAALTVAGGVLVVSFTEILKSLFIGPIIKLNEHIGTIIDRVIFYSARLTNFNDDYDHEEVVSMYSHLRSASAQLRARRQAIKLYGLWAFLRFVPKDDDIKAVSTKLIGLSNGIPLRARRTETDFIQVNQEAMEDIANRLGFSI